MGNNLGTLESDDDSSTNTLYDPHYEPPAGGSDIALWKYYYDYCREGDNYDSLKANSAYGNIDKLLENPWCAEWARQMEDKSGSMITELQDPLSPGCTKEVWMYIKGNILHLINPDKYEKPEDAPGMVCSIIGLFAIFNILGALGLIAYFGKNIFDVVTYVFGSLFGIVRSGAVYTSGFISKVGTTITEDEGPIVNLIKYMLDWFFDLVNGVISLTEVSPGLLYLNVLTLAALMIAVVFKDTECLIDRFKGTIYSTVFKIVDWPFQFILDVVQQIDQGKGFFYYLAKFLVLPFQGGALALSLLIGSLLFVLDQFLAVVKEDIERDHLPPVVSAADYRKRL